jgi:hypothetical protein
MTTAAILLARKQRLAWLRQDPGPNERDELEPQIAELAQLLDQAEALNGPNNLPKSITGT